MNGKVLDPTRRSVGVNFDQGSLSYGGAKGEVQLTAALSISGPAKRQTTSDTVYELAIVGGGIAGCMLAAAMARNGVKVVILESSTYPKFAIGESMILETSELMRSLALVFDVPELEHFS